MLKMLIGGNDEMYGLQLVERSEGELARGTAYVLLDRMEEKGYVTSRQEERRPGVSGIPRRLYRITGLGASAYQAREHAAAVFGGMPVVANG